jgi:alpha-beta hydrolase superfamily lysophospholipase
MLGKLMKIFLGILIGISLILTSCSSLFYYPSSDEFYKKELFPFPIEDNFITDQKGNQIHYWYLKSEKAKGKILLFHGNAQNLTSHVGLLAWIVKYNYDLMIFDYPGYGKSSGKPSPESTVISGIAAIEKIIAINPELPLFLYGHSLGGQILQKCINLKSEVNYKALFVEASFLSYRNVARDALAKNWITWIFQPVGWMVMSDEWAGDPSSIAPKPLYVIHGEQDKVVSLSQGQQIFDKAKSPKTFIPIKNAGHGNIYYIENGKYRNQLLTILNSFI